MQSSTVISIATLLISIFAAYSAHQANISAGKLQQKQFDSEITINLLKDISENLKTGRDNGQDFIKCELLNALRKAEFKAETPEPLLVRDFMDKLSKADYWNPDCTLLLLSQDEDVAPSPAPAPFPVPAPVVLPDEPGISALPDSVDHDDVNEDGTVEQSQSESPEQLGRWHTLIASYEATQEGCEKAQADVKEFTGLLQSLPQGKMDQPVEIGIIRTRISDHYGVSMDTGDDLAQARQLSRLVRSVAKDSADKKTGADSFVQENRDWYRDPECP